MDIFSSYLISPSYSLIKKQVLLAESRLEVGFIQKNFVARTFVQMTPMCVNSCNWNNWLLKY